MNFVATFSDPLPIMGSSHMSLRKLIIPALISLVSCTGGGQFARYEQEEFGTAEIGSSVTKVISLQNPNLSEVQHVAGLSFDTGTNADGHFSIDKVEVGGVAVNPRDRDISVPAGSILQVTVTYRPLNLDTTIADYGGWSTGGEERWMPKKPTDETEENDAVKTMSALVGVAPFLSSPPSSSGGRVRDSRSLKAATPINPATHRAILALAYDYPDEGIVQIELVGEAVPGPSGEVSAVGGGAGTAECPTEAGTACYTGGFAMELPDIMTGGPKPLELTGPVVFKLSGSNVTLDMNTFPAVLLVLKGNGPGEPLEGKPINAISIVISGAQDVTATGTFDGSDLTLNGASFRIRVVLGEITKEDITPGLQAAVDFNMGDLTITTTKPYTNGSIMLSIDTTLSAEPSGNPMFDQFLGGTRIVVVMDGMLTIY